MGLGAGVRTASRKIDDRLDRVVRETVLEFGGSLVTEWTPYGDPTSWKSSPPADYRPGNLQSSWFLSVDQPSAETTNATDRRTLHGVERLPDHPAGTLIYISNNAPHAGAIEYGHSSQAPGGIMVSAQEFEGIANGIARRLSL